MRRLLLLACLIPLALAATAVAQPLDSSGSVVEVPTPASPGGLPPAQVTPVPGTDAQGRPLPPLPADATNPNPEHPVYKLRPTPYSDEGKVLVTLDDVMALALDNNLGVRGQQLLVEKSHYQVDQTYYLFDPSLSASLAYSKRNTGATGALAQNGVTSSEGVTAKADYVVPSTFGDSLDLSYQLSHSRFSTISGGTGTGVSTYGSGPSVNYTRPLLRGAGKYLHLIPRYQAGNNLELQVATLNDSVDMLKKNVLDAYFNAVAAREAIDVRQASLDRALAQLDRAVERYKVGLGIQADVLQAENAVLTQRSALLSAEEDYDKLVDSLTALVGLPKEFAITVDAVGALLNTDKDLSDTLPPDLWTLVEDDSIDLHRLKTQLANLRLNRDALANKTKPQLDLAASYGRTGEDPTLSGAIGKLPNESYSVGLNWKTTPGERAAKTDVAMNEIDLAALDLQIKDADLQLKTKLRDFERDLSVKRQQIDLAKSNVTVNQANVDIVTARNQVGLATELDVVVAQENLLSAQLSLLQAQVAYQQSYRGILLLAGLI